MVLTFLAAAAYLAAIFAGGFTLIGLIGLFVYAADTKQFARASIMQAKAAQRPFLIVGALGGHLRVRNDGAGPARSIAWRLDEPYDPSRYRWSRLSDLAVGAVADIIPLGENLRLRELTHPIRIEYADLAGARYFTKAWKDRGGEISIETGEL